MPTTIRPRMRWRVSNIKVLPSYRLHVGFIDGLEGIVDMSALVTSPGAGVFAALADFDLFARVNIDHGL
jgi:hypothetical protein